ncbi:pyrroline-5-carboxylate reductase [Brachybacterium sp. GCM10030252]|uniref:pyrroline-5-carboxylate reductase n=1 Tax=Brachybacterium sp. GCM10030252 TaxID=3273380 RepID=UPI00361A7BF8
MTASSSHPAAHTSAEQSGPDLSGVRIALIGAGNMGGAVARAFLSAGVAAENLQIVNSTSASSERAAAELGATAASRSEALEGADVVVLGVKPYQVLDLLSAIRDSLPAGAVVISLAAGVTIAAMEAALPAGMPVERAMPNTPIAVGEGAVGLMRGTSVEDAQHALVHALFARAGVAVDIAEEQVHAFIGAAGSLPAFTYLIIEAMTDEAVRLGLKRDLAASLIQQTVRGAATVLSETGAHPAAAKNAVSSPGGTTVQGLAAMERAGVRAGVAGAMAAAADHSRQMAGD